MLFFQFFPLLLAAGFPAATQTTQTFSNTGIKSGWKGYTEGHKGTVQAMTNVVYKGDSALKMTQIYDSSWTGRYHSEAIADKVYKKGDTGYYGFAFRLQQDWEFTPDLSFNIAQFITDFTDLDCTEAYMPATMVWLIGDQLAARVKTGNVCPQDEQKTTTWRELATVSAGVWHTVEIQADWQSGATGFSKLWLDGQLVLSKTGIATTATDGRAFDFRAGLYANG